MNLIICLLAFLSLIQTEESSKSKSQNGGIYKNAMKIQSSSLENFKNIFQKYVSYGVMDHAGTNFQNSNAKKSGKKMKKTTFKVESL